MGTGENRVRHDRSKQRSPSDLIDEEWALIAPSITLETAFCLDAVNEALSPHGKPAIFNTDQGSQFTSVAFTGLLQEQKIKIGVA
jgi:transposase InsO family protein